MGARYHICMCLYVCARLCVCTFKHNSRKHTQTHRLAQPQTRTHMCSLDLSVCVCTFVVTLLPADVGKGCGSGVSCSTHPPTHTPSHTLSLTQTDSLSLSHTHTLSLSHTHSLFFLFSLWRARALSLTFSLCVSFSRSHSLLPSFSSTLPLFPPLSLFLSLSQTYCRVRESRGGDSCDIQSPVGGGHYVVSRCR
jgi:hypothetical protein